MFSRCRTSLNRSIFRVATTVHRPLPRPVIQRHFSVSPRPQVQYTRFSNQYTHHRRLQDRNRNAAILFVVALGGVYFVAHLERVPETGRWRFMAQDPEREAYLGKDAYRTLMAQFGDKILPANHPITRQVYRVVSDLLEASDLGTLRSTSPGTPTARHDPFSAHHGPFDPAPSHDDDHASSNKKEWNLVVVDDPDIVNALADFSNIVVFTGILPVCQDEAGLAAVVAHEIGHIVARHASERMSYYKLLDILAIALSMFGVDFAFTRLLNYLAFQLPNSRAQELEADTLSMRIIAKACYDPRDAVAMHKRLAEASETGGLSRVGFLRTHPLPERRIGHLQELLPEAYEIRAASTRCAGVRESIEQFLGGINRWG